MAETLHPFRDLRKNFAAGYDPKTRPWIKPENATEEQLIAQIDKCPSGALSYKINETAES